jgi:hypothetical protein
MPLANWLVFDNLTPAQEAANRIGAFTQLCDGAGPVWGPVYEDLDAEGGPKYAVEFNNTLMQAPGYTVPRTWSVAATPENNPYQIGALVGDPLFSESEMERRQQIELNNFVEHDYSTPPEEDPE